MLNQIFMIIFNLNILKVISIEILQLVQVQKEVIINLNLHHWRPSLKINQIKSHYWSKILNTMVILGTYQSHQMMLAQFSLQIIQEVLPNQEEWEECLQLLNKILVLIQLITLILLTYLLEINMEILLLSNQLKMSILMLMIIKMRIWFMNLLLW
jgi:hypothetical protein